MRLNDPPTKSLTWVSLSMWQNHLNKVKSKKTNTHTKYMNQQKICDHIKEHNKNHSYSNKKHTLINELHYHNMWLQNTQVGQHSSTLHNNCSFCDKSTKFGRCVDRYIGNKTGYWAITNSHPGGRGSHFSKWPPAVGQTFLSRWTHMQ